MSSFLTLNDFHPEQIALRESNHDEEQEIMALLGRFTAQMIVDGLRSNGGHPDPEWGGESTWRYYYIQECKKRGIGLLESLNWSTNHGAKYVNRHTKNVDTLINVATPWTGTLNDPIADKVWSIVEHWDPFEGTNGGD